MSMKNSYTNSLARKLGFRSGFESEMAKVLQDNGVEYGYETEDCKFEYFKPVVRGSVVDRLYNRVNIVKGGKVVQECTYTVDFIVFSKDSPKPTFLETKGRFTSSDRAKMDLIKKQHPNADIRMVFQADGKATPKKRYSEWCEDRGIPYFIIQRPTKNKEGIYLPEDWIDEFTSN